MQGQCAVPTPTLGARLDPSAFPSTAGTPAARCEEPEARRGGRSSEPLSPARGHSAPGDALALEVSEGLPQH